MKLGNFIVVAMMSIFLFSGCVRKALFVEYAQLDLSDKSITVPIGGDLFLTEVKKGLIDDGWEIQVYDKSTVTTIKNNTTETFANYHTKYKLLINYITNVDGVLVGYDISVLDNKNGKEVITLHQYGAQQSKESAQDILSWFRGQSKDRFKTDDRTLKDKVTDWAKSVIK